MRFETVVDSLNFAWDQVVVAFWARYPNPFTTHVLTEDVLRRELRPDGSLYTCRLLMKTNSIPKWGQSLMPASRVPIIEESIVDPNKKTLTTYCRNITHKSLMETTEKVVYTSRNDENGTPFTHCHKMFWVSSQWYAPTGGWIERFGIQRWVKNVVKTRQGLEHVLGQIYVEDDAALEDASMAASTATSTSTASPEVVKSGAVVATRHPFIAEKRRMLKEAATAMGHKAKARLKQPIDQAKEKLKQPIDHAKEKLKQPIDHAKEKLKQPIDQAKEKYENAKVTIGTAQDNLKDKLGVREA